MLIRDLGTPVLPLEKMIDYSKIVVRVPYTDIENTGAYIVKFYERHSNEEFTKAQKKAREVFETHLRYDAFFNRVLPLLKEKGIEVF